MIVSHQHRYVFLKTRKTAGTSVEIALSAHVGPGDVVTASTSEDERLRPEWGGAAPQNQATRPWRWDLTGWYQLVRNRRGPVFYNHMPARRVRPLIGRRRFDDYFVFTIERNPWDRIVSAWRWEAGGYGRHHNSLAEFLESPQLERFHNWPIYTIGDEVVADRIIIYDNLEEDLSEVTDKVGLPRLELPRTKSQHRTDRRPYQEWYTPDTRDRVAEVFSREIDYFGWTFG